MTRKAGVTAALLLAALALAAQSVKVVSPNGDESWALNTAHDITWTTQGSNGVKVDIILRRGGARIGYVKRNVDLSTGRWPWTLVGKLDDGSAVPAATDYQIRIRDVGGAFFDDSDRNFAIAAAVKVVNLLPEHITTVDRLIKAPRLEVTAISLVRNAGGYGIVFGYKNAGNAALPKRSQLPARPDYRVLVDGREVDKGDLFIPENPPAGPGWEMTTHSGGSINFPSSGDPRPWNIGKEITIILNERNVLGMGSASKTSSLLPIALTVGYDLAFGPVSFDWNTCKATVMITKVGANPQLSKEFFLKLTIRGYHPKETKDTPRHVATVTYPEGPFTQSSSTSIPAGSAFPQRLEIPICGIYSTFYELEFNLRPDYRDEFDERNNSAPRVRYNRPESPRGPRILSIACSDFQYSNQKWYIQTTITLFNKDTRRYDGLRLVVKRDGSQIQEYRNIAIDAGRQVIYMKDSAMAPHYPYIVFDAYLYDSGGTLLDARSEKR